MSHTSSKRIPFMPLVPTLLALLAWSVMAEEPKSPTPSDPYPVMHTKSRYAFRPVAGADEWNRYREWIRQHVLVSSGLWPTPPKCNLDAVRLDAKAFDGFKREKIYFWSFPGVIVTGALYTPTNATGRLPAVLCPHGHWDKGRLHESPQARFINLAKQGYVVLAIDMVGYNDNGPLPHDFAGDKLWGLSLGGLQLWNCIRSVDLLASMENVDPKRIGVTGASGGGTQTFMLCAVDDRPAVAAPVCMISAHFQGGCLCENAPLMRVQMNNMEIGAAMAPRPLVLVSATGDWTKDTPTVEYPAIRKVYELLGATDRIAERQFNLGHNYDKPSREVVYSWFARWLKDAPPDTKVAEQPYMLDTDLRIFGQGRERPKEAKSPAVVVQDWQAMVRKQMEELQPGDAATLKRFRETLQSSLWHTLCMEPTTQGQLVVERAGAQTGDGTEIVEWRLGLKNRCVWLRAKSWEPQPVPSGARGVLLVHPKGIAGIEASMIKSLVTKGCILMAVDTLQMGKRRPTDDKFYYTYNRSNLAIRVQEIAMGLAALPERQEVARVDVVGLDQAGLWALFARAISDAPKRGSAIFDACQFDTSTEDAWNRNEMFSPGILRTGGTDTAGALIAPHPLTIHNAGTKFATRTTEAAYRAAGASKTLRVVVEKRTEQASFDCLAAN